MDNYQEFQCIMADLEYFKENGIPRDTRYLKDKDGNNVFDDFFWRIFK